MKRRSFISKNIALGAVIPASYGALGFSHIKNGKNTDFS
jgi:hypothetical protein